MRSVKFKIIFSSLHPPDLSKYILEPDGNFYYHFTTRKIYEDARCTCKSEGASLPVVKDVETQRFIDAKYGNEYFWLSATDSDGAGWKWEFADGSKECMTGFTNWKLGEPNNPKEHCSITERGIGWSDVDCKNRRLEFLCQILQPGSGKSKHEDKNWAWHGLS